MPQASAWHCNGCPSGLCSTYGAQRYRKLVRDLTAKQVSLRHAPTAIVVKASDGFSASDNVQVGQTQFGRGLLSRGDLSSGERLLSVPFHQLLMLPDEVDPSFQKIQNGFWADHGELPADLFRFLKGGARWDLRLTAWLLWLAKYGSTFWKQYVQFLPKEHDMTCLINYSPEEQHELQWLAQEAAAQHSWAQDSHETLFSSQTGQLKSLQLADSLQDTLWAMSLVRSRTFSERVHNTDLALMVPTADLANHSFQQNSVYTLRASQGAFEMKTCRSIKDREAICITYGADKTNAELMRDYGFFVPGNPHDRLDFTVRQQHTGFVAKPANLLFKALNGSPAPLKEEERPQLLAGPFLKALGLAGKVQAGKLHPEGMSQQETSAACAGDASLARSLSAVLSLPVVESATQVDGSRAVSSFWPPKSFTESGEPALKTTLTNQERRHQERAIDMLQQHCRTLQAWGTSLETDEDLVSSFDLTSRHRQAISARLEHKQVIQAACSALETYKHFVKDTVVVERLVQT